MRAPSPACHHRLTLRSFLPCNMQLACGVMGLFHLASLCYFILLVSFGIPSCPTTGKRPDAAGQKLRAHLVGLHPASNFRTVWLPGPSRVFAGTGSQSTPGTGPGETSGMAVSPGPGPFSRHFGLSDATAARVVAYTHSPLHYSTHPLSNSHKYSPNRNKIYTKKMRVDDTN
jgi:hypothetical protein